MNKIERAHQMYRDGSYQEALVFYTEALGMSKTKTQKIALHSNRAACYLKLHDFKKAADECTSVLELDHKHTGALMLRAQTLVTLKEYHSALFDVNRLIELNPSSEIYQHLQARLKMQLSLAPIPEAEVEQEEDEDRDAGSEGGEEEGQEEEEVEGAEKFYSVEIGETQNKESEELVPKIEATIPENPNQRRIMSSRQDSEGLKEPPELWETIPKPKGHSRLDYSRWDRVEDDSSDEDDDEEDEDCQPQYRFRVRTVGVKTVK